MFWIGIIVGVIIGDVVSIAGVAMFALKATNMTIDEIAECGLLIQEAGNNREATLQVWHNGKIIDEVKLEE